jgi:hypothetical protein
VKTEQSTGGGGAGGDDNTPYLSPRAFPSKQWQILLQNTTVNPNQHCISITSMFDCCVVIGVFIVIMDNLDQLEK